MVAKISRRNILLATSGAAGLAALPGTNASAATPGIRTVQEFLDSLGVGTHMGQGVDAAPGVATALSYLGIRHIRDDGNLEHVPDWIDLHRRSGARVDLLTNHDIDETLQMARDLHAAGALLAVEGPNEPNNWAVTYQGKTSGFDTTFLPVAQLQRDLYRAVHTDSRLAGIPVFASSEAGGSEPDDVGLQFLQIPAGTNGLMPAGTRYADFANTHTYPQGHTGDWVDNIAWNGADPTLNGDWDGLYVEFGRTWHGGFAGYRPSDLITLPRVMTETGWTTQGDGSISADQQGRLHLCLYLANFARGWTHTFIYMLRDDPAQGYWGLVDTDYQPKTSGRYVHNLTTILGERAPGRAASPVPYTIPAQSATVHDLQLSGAGGADVIVWNEQKIGAADVFVDLGRAFETVEVYDPTAGTTPTRRLRHVRSLDLTLEGYAVAVLKF